MQLFFNNDLSTDSKNIQFNREESKHIIKVLRKKNKDLVYITNGKGFLFTAEITLDLPNKCEAKIIDTQFQEKSNLHIHIAIAPTKMNDRYEWFLEKACEIGIQEITPIICEHSERKVIKEERLKKIIQSACKQSLQYHVPQLNRATTFSHFISNHHNETLLIAHCEPSKKQSLKEVLNQTSSQSYTVLIGPEGDFSNHEIDLATRNNYIPITLGETRLRTETAGLVAVHSIVFSN